jgi:hypothetical protein
MYVINSLLQMYRFFICNLTFIKPSMLHNATSTQNKFFSTLKDNSNSTHSKSSPKSKAMMKIASKSIACLSNSKKPYASKINLFCTKSIKLLWKWLNCAIQGYFMIEICLHSKRKSPIAPVLNRFKNLSGNLQFKSFSSTQ